MRNFEQILYILSSLLSAQVGARLGESQYEKKLRESIKREFVSHVIRALLGLILIIIFAISLSSINNQAGLLLLEYNEGLLLFFLFHGLLLCGSSLGIIMIIKLKYSKENSESLDINEKNDRSEKNIDALDGYRLAATFCIGFIEGWQRASNKSDS